MIGICNWILLFLKHLFIKIRNYFRNIKYFLSLQESETETEKADSTKEEKESTEELTKVVKPTLGERMSSFFRMNKNSAEEKIVENLDKPDDTLTEVVIDNKKIEENGIEDNKVDGKGDEEKTLEVLLTFLFVCVYKSW